MADYDVSVLDISPSGLKTAGDRLVEHSKSVAESLGTIQKQLEGLRLAWQGKAASAADDVNKEWLRVMTELFGTEEDPHKGVLSTLADGVGMAAFNFAATENAIAGAFAKFRAGLTDTSGKKPDDKAPDAQTDPNLTAVTMTFPG